MSYDVSIFFCVCRTCNFYPLCPSSPSLPKSIGIPLQTLPSSKSSHSPREGVQLPSLTARTFEALPPNSPRQSSEQPERRLSSSLSAFRVGLDLWEVIVFVFHISSVHWQVPEVALLVSECYFPSYM